MAASAWPNNASGTRLLASATFLYGPQTAALPGSIMSSRIAFGDHRTSDHSINRAAGGDRPDLLDTVAAHADIPVVKVDGRVAVAGDQADLVAKPGPVAAETASLPCSSEARS
jgi:hypothetical protein